MQNPTYIYKMIHGPGGGQRETTMEDSIHDRGQAMEDLFFARSDFQLLENLRAEMAQKEACDALKIATGIEDVEVLNSMAASEITPGSVASLALIPLVLVAWSDKKMDASEKASILKSADCAGVKEGNVGYSTLENWLNEAPGPELFESWKLYIGALKEKLDGAAYSQLRVSVMQRAENVAEAAGGFLGLIPKISDVERKTLDELSAAFD